MWFKVANYSRLEIRLDTLHIYNVVTTTNALRRHETTICNFISRITAIIIVITVIIVILISSSSSSSNNISSILQIIKPGLM